MVRKYKKHPFWDDEEYKPLDELEEEFERIKKYADSIFEKAEKGELNEKDRFVCGFSMRIGPDGIPKIQQFGSRGRAKGEIKLEKEYEEVLTPLTDIIEGEKDISITVELPGVRKEDIDVRFEEDSVTISVDSIKRKYYKKIPLTTKIDLNQAKATYRNGVLDIVLPKREKNEEKGKKISIE